MNAAENVLGGEGRGIYVLFSGLDIERGAGASGCIGWAPALVLILMQDVWSDFSLENMSSVEQINV